MSSSTERATSPPRRRNPLQVAVDDDFVRLGRLGGGLTAEHLGQDVDGGHVSHATNTPNATMMPMFLA